jgi:hypothetical protein|tara:strand:- start:233 stop:463 length:231 start_codon:yes stop_codon:yes gene_type:complete
MFDIKIHREVEDAFDDFTLTFTDSMIEAQLESYEMLTLTGLVSPAIQEFVKTMSDLMDGYELYREPTQLELDLTLN